MEAILYLMNIATLVALIIAIAYTAGVVWRVEFRLDTSYKFFLVGIIFFFLAEIIDFWYVPESRPTIAAIVEGLRMLFSFCFLIGVVFMRGIVRNLDGEKARKE
ncbi:MAG: hypothetical protein KBD19_03955 [Candidatus Moranbacteria bacterium]|jgi:hypothetical protein|nr:hypothetical protein [Candidatus Moranbacteria bacterium]